MKTLLRNKLHQMNGSRDTSVVEISGKKFKLSYDAYNAGESFDVEMFTPEGWQHIYSIQDLGHMPNKSAYHLLTPSEREKRVDVLIKEARKAVEILLK